jgi:hypothetical protein
MATNNKPASTLRCGNIKATIWQNVSEKGPFFATTFSRPFEDQFGVWRNGTSFGLNDSEALSRFTGKPPALRGLPSQLKQMKKTSLVLRLMTLGFYHTSSSVISVAMW